MEKEILEQLKRIADSLEKMTPVGLGGCAGGLPIVRHIHEYPQNVPSQYPPSYTTF